MPPLELERREALCKCGNLWQVPRRTPQGMDMGSPDAKRAVRRRSLGVLIVLATGLWSLNIATWPDHGRRPLRSGESGTTILVRHTLSEAPWRPAGVGLPPAPHIRKMPALATADPGSPASDPLEICGFGTVALVADDPYRLGHLPSAVRERTLGEVEAQMLASPDQEVQAAGLLLGARARVESRDHIDRLVRLAVASQDPLVYAIALEGCNSWTGREAASCALLSASQLVRLDPEDAQPWLDLAAQAQAQHDPDAEFEAMRHAATARRSGSHQGFMASLVDRALGTRSKTAQRTFAASES